MSLYNEIFQAVDAGLKKERRKHRAQTSPNRNHVSPTATLVDVDCESPTMRRLGRTTSGSSARMDSSPRVIHVPPGMIPFPHAELKRTPYSPIQHPSSPSESGTPRRRNLATPKSSRNRSSSPKPFHPYQTPNYSSAHPALHPTLGSSVVERVSDQLSPTVIRRSSMPNMALLDVRPSVASPSPASHKKTPSQATAWEPSTPERELKVEMHSPKPRRASLALHEKIQAPDLASLFNLGTHEMQPSELDPWNDQVSPSAHSQSSPSQFVESPQYATSTYDVALAQQNAQLLSMLFLPTLSVPTSHVASQVQSPTRPVAAESEEPFRDYILSWQT